VIGRRHYAALFVSLTAALATLGLASAQGLAAGAPSTLTVAPKSSNACPNAGFHTIQDAINAAKSGDTVFVCAGKYVEGDADPGSNARSR
jgi:pectin methylesterase-like acyl-CoA thioesterase